MASADLGLNSWPEVEAYLERSQLIVIPVGSTEQHGPNGLIGTDYICAETIGRRAAEMASVMFAPTISVGMAQHHLAFPGTISYRSETLIEVLRDYASSLYRHGFRQFVFVNGHGGNVATARVALSALETELPEARFRWLNWYQAAAVETYARDRFGDREGSHATPSEVSVTMAAHPGAVTPIDGPLDIESCRSRGIPGSEKFRELYPDGRMGSDPSMATREHGDELLRLAVGAVCEEIRKLASTAA